MLIADISQVAGQLLHHPQPLSLSQLAGHLLDSSSNEWYDHTHIIKELSCFLVLISLTSFALLFPKHNFLTPKLSCRFHEVYISALVVNLVAMAFMRLVDGRLECEVCILHCTKHGSLECLGPAKWVLKSVSLGSAVSVMSISMEL